MYVTDFSSLGPSIYYIRTYPDRKPIWGIISEIHLGKWGPPTTLHSHLGPTVGTCHTIKVKLLHMCVCHVVLKTCENENFNQMWKLFLLGSKWVPLVVH